MTPILFGLTEGSPSCCPPVPARFGGQPQIECYPSCGAASVIARLIRWSLANRFMVLLAAVFVACVGRLVGDARRSMPCQICRTCR